MKDDPHVQYDELELGGDQLLMWRGHPFTGTAYETDPAGTVIGDARYVQGLQTGAAHENGSKHGLCRRWYENSQLESEAEYRFSIKVREKCWSADGMLVKDWSLPHNDAQWALIALLERRFQH